MFNKFVSVGQSWDLLVIYNLLTSHSLLPSPQMRLQQEQKNMFWKNTPLLGSKMVYTTTAMESNHKKVHPVGHYNYLPWNSSDKE